MRRKKAILIKSKPTFAIVVDGKTEVWYFNMLIRNERGLKVTIKPELPNKRPLSDQFTKVKELAEDYTKVFWILDFDVILKETREAERGTETPLQEFEKYSAQLKKKNKNVVIIINNPCIEFWLLLHFEPKSKFFDSCTSAEKQLKKHLKDYEKTRGYYTKQNSDIYLKLKPRLRYAIDNAKKLKGFDVDEPNQALAQMNLLFETKELKDYFKKQEAVK